MRDYLFTCARDRANLSVYAVTLSWWEERARGSVLFASVSFAVGGFIRMGRSDILVRVSLLFSRTRP